MRRRWLGGLVVAVALVGVFGVWSWTTQPKLPNGIRKQVSFTIFKPSRKAGVKVVRNGYAYDQSARMLTTTVVASASGAKIVMTQQATPPPFTEAPQLYTQFVNKLNRTADFETPQGRVFLTKPTNLAGNAAAILESHGTLIIARAESEIDRTQWQKLFTNLEISR
jgi:hypothetical protein